MNSASRNNATGSARCGLEIHLLVERERKGDADVLQDDHTVLVSLTQWIWTWTWLTQGSDMGE